jgi:hypothetical protein
MVALRVVIYSATIVVAMFFGFWELRLKAQLTDGVLSKPTAVSESDFTQVLSKKTERERALQALPRAETAKFRKVVALKCLFVALLIIEIFGLQRPR